MHVFCYINKPEWILLCCIHGRIYFYEKIYGMVDFCIDGSIDDSLFKCTEKDTKDQAQITTAAKESATQTEAAKTTSKKRRTKRKR